MEKEGRKPDKNLSLRRLEFIARNLDQKCRSKIPSQSNGDFVSYQ
jgi:hypothetical protein